MAEPTLTDLFGAGATQTADELIIKKSALQTKGLNPSATNTAESLLVAIVLQSADTLTETARSSDTLNRSLTLTYSGQDLLDQGGINFRRDSFLFSLYRQQALTAVNPNDY